MDIQPQSTKPISDDQELAKVLAGVTGNMGFEETPKPVAAPVQKEEQPNPTVMNQTQDKPAETTPVEKPAEVGELDGIKNEALLELRPLLDKLDIAAEEKFDIYLLLLRSTDDKSLIDPAHHCAQKIVDESRKAQALLDIIKEIDFLSAPAK